ncbi:MAG: hypothetical protein GX208_08655 [Firmicutes bacterium]|nr:hypothetical protein [Bacillota bacterium]
MSESAKIERDKSSGRNWTEQEKDLVWEEVIKGKQEGLPLTACFRRISRLLPHRSEAAIGMLFYNVLRKERDEKELEVTTKSSPVVKPKIDNDLIEAFQGLPEYIAQLHKRIDSLESQIKSPSIQGITAALVELANGYQRAEQLDQETNGLQEKLQQLAEENNQLREQLHKIQQAYNDALGIYDMFTNMASISQIMSLGDFKQQMKTTLDKWGNVLNVSFERVN